MSIDPEALGLTAFEAYTAHRSGVNAHGGDIPDWEHLPHGIREAWKAGAMSVVQAVITLIQPKGAPHA